MLFATLCIAGLAIAAFLSGVIIRVIDGSDANIGGDAAREREFALRGYNPPAGPTNPH